jgi:hypothetical protein
MKQDLKKLEEEKANLLQKLQEIEIIKNKTLTRVVELQGIIKYIKENNKED